MFLRPFGLYFCACFGSLFVSILCTCSLGKWTLTLWCVLGVGKTSMVLRYVGKMFSQHISPTIGASFFTCKLTVEDTRVKLQVQLLPYSYVVLCLVYIYIYIYKFNLIMLLLQGLGHCWTGEVSFHGTNVLSECQCCTNSIWHHTVWYISGCERLGERYVLDGMMVSEVNMVRFKSHVTHPEYFMH